MTDIDQIIDSHLHDEGKRQAQHERWEREAEAEWDDLTPAERATWIETAMSDHGHFDKVVAVIADHAVPRETWLDTLDDVTFEACALYISDWFERKRAQAQEGDRE
ncbi:MAG: hypothetical protein IPH13_20230 [Planctomycetes bacterium]|nr:hypothetical protein [Planctomycetota bacterium]